MAKYQIMYWNEFPSQIKVRDEQETVKRLLPDRFQVAIDGASMAEGSTGSDAYLQGWQWGPQERCEGVAREVADALLAELDAAYPQSRLVEMVRACAQAGGGS